MSVNSQKSELRKAFKAKRAAISADCRREFDKAVFENISSLKCFKECKTLLAYASTENEVGTKDIINEALRQGKRVALPKCKKGGEMDFYLIRSLEDLSLGAYSILEPVPEKCERLEDFSSGLCLVPALSFDKNGYRLGYGGGYYDRFLAKFKGVSAGLTYSMLLSDTLPKDEFDKAVNAVVTEKGVIL